MIFEDVLQCNFLREFTQNFSKSVKNYLKNWKLLFTYT